MKCVQCNKVMIIMLWIGFCVQWYLQAQSTSLPKMEWGWSLTQYEKIFGPALDMKKDPNNQIIEAEFTSSVCRIKVFFRNGKTHQIFYFKEGQIPFSSRELETILGSWHDPQKGMSFLPVDYLEVGDKMGGAAESDPYKIFLHSLKYQSWMCEMKGKGALFAVLNRDTRVLILFWSDYPQSNK